MDKITFTDDIDGRIYPDKQWIKKFYVSEKKLERHEVLVKPLLLRNLASDLIRANIQWLKWGVARLLYKIGFLQLPEAEPFSWKHLTCKFWRRKRDRA